jgi:hypothetical protein
MLSFGDLLTKAGIEQEGLIILRHRPDERAFRPALVMLAGAHLELFNAYQRTQGPILEKSLLRARRVASFIGQSPGCATFVGIYNINGSTPLSFEQYWQDPVHHELGRLGMIGFTSEEAAKRGEILQFNFELSELLSDLRGRLIVQWPPPERSWFRHADRNDFQIRCILEESAFSPAMPEWQELVVRGVDFGILPATWSRRLAEWRGVYLIRDSSDGQLYVGSAAGAENLLSRWREYAKTGHGGNTGLRDRFLANFTFSILQRVSPDMPKDEVVQIENSWKERLHTRRPHGLNLN